MTNEEKIKKILSCAASPVGMSCDVYYDVSKELIKQGVVEQRTVFSAVGNRKERIFLKKVDA